MAISFKSMGSSLKLIGNPIEVEENPIKAVQNLINVDGNLLEVDGDLLEVPVRLSKLAGISSECDSADSNLRCRLHFRTPAQLRRQTFDVFPGKGRLRER